MAVTGYFDAVQQIYIAFYQRPADPAGLRYWAERLEGADGDISDIVGAFANSTETQRLYGPIDNDTIGDVIGSIYQGLFGRAPDEAGRAYYEAAFANGTLNAGNIALAILNAAQNDDTTAIANKLIVANRFTETVDGRPFDHPAFGQGDEFAYDYTEEGKANAVRQALAAVTADPKSMLDNPGVKDVLDDKAPAPGNTGPVGKTYELTVRDDDDLTGQSGGDKFIAKLVEGDSHHLEMSIMDARPEWLPTLNDGDRLDGGGGRDLLTAEILGDVTPSSLTSIETVVLSGQGTLDLLNATGVEHLEIKGMDAAKLGHELDFGAMEDSSPELNLDIGVSAITVENLGAPLKSLTITDTLGLVAIDHGSITSNAQPSTLNLNLRDAIGVVAISGERVPEIGPLYIEDDEHGKPIYGTLAVNSGSVRGAEAYGNYVLLAGSAPSEITVTGKANFGFITGLLGNEDGSVPKSLDAKDFKGNLAAVMVGQGNTEATGGLGDDLFAFVSPPDNASGLLSIESSGDEVLVMDMPIAMINVDAGAGDDSMVFVGNANVDAKGGSGDDNFVFFNPQGAAGFNAGDSVDGDAGTDTLWLGVEGRYDEGIYRARAISTELFGDAPEGEGASNISGIEHVVHIAPSGMYGDLHVDMTRVDAGTVLELAADYDGYDVTVEGIAASEKEVDVILSGQDVRNLAIFSEKTEIGLTIRTVSDESRASLLDWLADEIGEEISLDVLARLHDSETYTRVLDLLKQTNDCVNIESLSLGETTTSLSLNLEETGYVSIHDLSYLGGNVSTITVQGGAHLSLGNDCGAYQGQTINAASASGDLELYVGSNVTNVLGGSGNNTVHVKGAGDLEIDVGAGGVDRVIFESSTADVADSALGSFGVNISKFEVDSDVIGIYADSVINAVSFIKLESPAEAEEEPVSFADLFEQAMGNVPLDVGCNANLLAVMYDAANQEAILFTVNSGDDVLDSSDADRIKVITTIGMDADEYVQFNADNIDWMCYGYN